MATVMNYKDEDIEKLEENNSQNNENHDGLLKEKQNNMNSLQQLEAFHKSAKASPNSQHTSESITKKEKSDDVNVKNSLSINNNTQDNKSNSMRYMQQQIYNNGMTSESNENVIMTESSNCQPLVQSTEMIEITNESSNGFKKSTTEKKDSNRNVNGFQNPNSSTSSNLRNNVFGTGISDEQQHSTLSQSQFCEQEGQIKVMKLAGLTVLMHRKKGEIIYRLADNMSVSSLSDAQREALLKEIKTLHDSNAIVTQSMPQFTQDQGTSSHSIINTAAANISRLQTATEHPPVISHDTSTRVPTSSPMTTTTDSVNSTTTMNTQTASKQLYIPLASSSQSSQTLYPSSPLEDSLYSDGSSRSTRRYTKTGRYAKKRSSDETDSQYTQEYPTQYQHMPTNTTIPISNQIKSQTHQLVQPVQSSQPIQSTYYTSATPTTRPIVQYYSAQTPMTYSSISRGVKRPFQSTGIQRTTEEINHHLDIVQRFDAAAKADQMAVLQPDYKTPFRSLKDAIARLLPYHIFEYPEEDMKGNAQTSELDATKNALRLYKRRKMIFDKYNDLIKKEAEQSCSTAYTNLCERLIVDDVKTEIMTLKEGCRQLNEQIKSRSHSFIFKHQQQLQQLQPQPPST